METEDTQDSSKADAAAVKRKRRSSILKNQRPPRTPFSEVEFNVATPPDTTKSRRVSFSRRTGVAEFVTNEATTTWRNFYEEHNKSLESSGNENNLVANAPRQTIEHIGKRIFDQQFEEVEAVDLGGTIHTNPLQQFQASFNKINLTQELATFECMTGDLKFVPSQSKFEQSALTELSKPFGNDMQCPVLEDMTNPLSMNFSTMQPMSSSKCDDLDEIQNYLDRSKVSAMGPGLMNPGKDFSGYIEVADLDVTHGVIHNDGSEMSITDTIESPKVQDAAKSSVQQSKHKDDDWTNDKENMVFNPYVAPKESLTFAVNQVSDEVLVFDGKRLTTQSITTNISENKENFHQTLLPNPSTNAPQRKTIILDVNDDLPNFIDNNPSKSNFNLHVSSRQPTDKMAVNVQKETDTGGNNKSIANETIDMCDTSNILSFTQAISSNIIAAKRESLHVKYYNDMIQNNLLTQPDNIIQINDVNKLQIDENEKRRTIIFAGESCDISMTQSLQSNVNFNSENTSGKNENTVIFDNNAHDISITQVLPTNIHVNIAKNVQDDLKNKKEKYATTQKRETIFDDEPCNMSITQAGPVNIIDINSESNNALMSGKGLNSEKRRTIIFDHEACDISITQALPTNINLNTRNEEKNYKIFDDKLTEYKHSKIHNTIIFDTESCDISMTQALPANIKLIEDLEKNNEIERNAASSKCLEKRRTIVFDKDSCDISMTQALPTNIDHVVNFKTSNKINEGGANEENSEKRRTIIFGKGSYDISTTQALPTNTDCIKNFEKSNDINKRGTKDENSEKRRTIIFDKESCDISLTQAIPTNIDFIENLERSNEINKSDVKEENSEKRRTIIFDKDSCDISMTQALPTNRDVVENLEKSNGINKRDAMENSDKHRTIIFDKDSCDISMTQVLPTNTDFIENFKKSNDINKRSTKDENLEKRRTIIFDKESCDISLTQAIPTNTDFIQNFDKSNDINKRGTKDENLEKRRTIIFDKESCDISLTQAIPTKTDFIENFEKSNDINKRGTKDENLEKRRTIIFDKESCDISLTQAIPTNIDFINNLERSNEINKSDAKKENSEKRRTIVFDKDSCDISMTQALPTNIDLLKNLKRNSEINERSAIEVISEKRRTIIFSKDSCDISMTQVLPTNINIIEGLERSNEINKICVNVDNTETRRTIVFDKDSCNMSVTQDLPNDIDFKENIEKKIKDVNESPKKRKTIIFEKKSCDLAMTQALPTNNNFDGENIKQQSVFKEKVTNNISEKRKTIIKSNDEESCDISMSRALPKNFNIFKESTDEVYENDIKLELENSSATFFGRVSDQFISKVIDNPNKFETKENKDVSQLAPTEKHKTVSVIDNNCKSSDHNQIEQFKTEKTNVTQNIEATDLCKMIQSNMFLHEDNKNTIPNISLSNSISHKNLDDKKTSFSHANKKHTLVDKTSYDMDIQEDVLSPLNKESNNKIFEHEYDQTSQYSAYEPGFKTNVSVYQVDTNKNMNKTSTDISNELLAGMDVDKPVELLKDKEPRDKKPAPKKSILDELLSMSCDSVKHNLSKFYENDDIIHGTEVINHDSILMSISKEINCEEGSLVERKITRKNEVQPESEIKSNSSVISIENEVNENLNECSYKESHAKFKNNSEKEFEGKRDLTKNLTKSNMELEESVKFLAELNSPKTFKSVKEADNTKDLLKMLSEITDEDGEEYTSKQENDDTKGKDYVKPSVTEKNTIVTKGTLQEPKRLSLAPRRQSTAISREDLLNNISMAKAALQQSRFEVDETDIMDDTSELIETHEINDTYKSNRMSTEVVKTLRFEDESASDTSIKSEIRMNPLGKSAVEEIPSINDTKFKVIPTFLTDASVHLKDFMHDLVKPNADAPFENNFTEIKGPSTCDAEVEANFITSSQIDVSQEEPSQYILKKSDTFISKSEAKNVGIEVSVSLLNEIKSSVSDSESINIVQHTKMTENIVECNVYDISPSSPQKFKHESIVFNSDSPLKNVLLPPIDYCDAHRYNQFREEKSFDDTKRKSSHNIKESDESNLGNRSFVNDALKDQKIAEQMNIVCGQTISESSGAPSLNVCKPICADKSGESVVPSLKDTEVNTMIVMKGNRDLIQRSSLTMVDERLMDSEFKINIEPSTEPPSEKVSYSKTSPVKILFRNENDAEFTEKDTDATSSDEINNIDLDAKTRKRSYSPTNTSSYVLSNVEVTPKPISKMQKISNSPITKSANNNVHTKIMQVDADEGEMKSPKNDESKVKSTAHTEIIQKVEVQYNNFNKSKSKPIRMSQTTKFDKEETSENKKSLKLYSEGALQDPSVTVTQAVCSGTSRIVTPLEKERENEIEKDYGIDVIENIKLLSFMGTSECEWERCGRADVWAFRVLCGRVRLSVRLRSAAVRADTPVAAVDVEIAKADEKDAIAGLCVSLAVEAMRYEAAEVSRADAVAALLRRCVRVSRLARRWARAMRDAHARLAYHVLPNGQISLKVANLPLRRVVEARLHVSLAVERARGAAYPCAGRLALAGAAPTADLARLADQPPDWGHVPRTIWKVFKYLKNRTRTEDLLGK